MVSLATLAECEIPDSARRLESLSSRSALLLSKIGDSVLSAKSKVFEKCSFNSQLEKLSGMQKTIFRGQLAYYNFYAFAIEACLKNDLSGALELIDGAIRLDEEVPWYKVFRGSVLGRMGRYSPAVESLTESISQEMSQDEDPVTLSQAYRFRGMIRLAVGSENWREELGKKDIQYSPTPELLREVFGDFRKSIEYSEANDEGLNKLGHTRSSILCCLSSMLNIIDSEINLADMCIRIHTDASIRVHKSKVVYNKAKKIGDKKGLTDGWNSLSHFWNESRLSELKKSRGMIKLFLEKNVQKGALPRSENLSGSYFENLECVTLRGIAEEYLNVR